MAVAIAVRQLHVPYTVAPVLTGLALGIMNLSPAPHLTKELLFTVFLPGLLFEAAFHVVFRQFRATAGKHRCDNRARSNRDNEVED